MRLWRKTINLAPGVLAGAVVLLVCFVFPAEVEAVKVDPDKVSWGSPKAKRCKGCHRHETPGLYYEWRQGAHGKAGVNCYDCHRAEKGDPDAIRHKKSFDIAIIVTPKDCGRCHEHEANQFRNSHHARAVAILDGLENHLGKVVVGEAAVNSGCVVCHGSTVKMKDGKLDPATWPNTGIARVNLDGSIGSCSACHTRHRFSKAQARQPVTCGRCHSGDHQPQLESYNSSKHGMLFAANREKMNLESDRWIAGKDYYDAPTCTTCHMGEVDIASGRLEVTHDVGERLSWNLRGEVSEKYALVVYENGARENWPEDGEEDVPEEGDEVERNGKTLTVEQVLDVEARREKMTLVCMSCHSEKWAQAFYTQLDRLVELYNDKFAKPGLAIMNELKESGRLTRQDFDERLEWIWYELWRKAGRSARSGWAMTASAEYTWWQGMYEVGKRFYSRFLPEVKKVAGNELYQELLDKHVKDAEGQEWFFEARKILASLNKAPPKKNDAQKQQQGTGQQ